MTSSELKYLIAINELCKNGDPARQTDLSAKLKVTKVSTFNAVERLCEKNYVTKEKARVSLTDDGRAILRDYMLIIDFMDRISKHQEDLKINNNDPAIPLWQLAKELKSPKSSDESLPPDLSTKILMSILNNRPYPEYLLQTVVRRVKVDKDEKDGKRAKFIAVNSRRVRIIKAYLTRSNYYKGDEYMIDSVSQSEAFKCGRLFAVLERIQYTALGEVNSTIKDKFFASACSTPQTVFCRLIKLAQPHLAKIKSEKGDGAAIYYDKLISDIVSGMNGFPKTLSLQKQGDFIIGYYQQRQKFFESKASGGEEQ